MMRAVSPKGDPNRRIEEAQTMPLETRIACWAIALLALAQLLTYQWWQLAIAPIILLIIVGLTSEDGRH